MFNLGVDADFGHPSFRYKYSEEGAVVEIKTLEDVLVGSTVVAVKGNAQVTKGMEYTVTAITPSRIDFMAKGKKYNLKSSVFVECFNRRVGRVLPTSIKKGLSLIALVGGDGISKGDIITLTETGGKLYSYVTADGRKGTVDANAIPLAFLYV